MPKHLIVVGGPTASGKTAWAIRLARHFGTEILSADSRQFYRELMIGTARPSETELSQAPHHFIGHLSISRPYSVGDFERDALRKLEELFASHDVVVLAGGSGLYVKALCEGLDEFPQVPAEVRAEVEILFASGGLPALQAELERLDPEYFARVDLSNPARLIRAISVCRASGRKFSEFRSESPSPRFFTPIYLQLHWPRAALYDRINRRVDDMVARGLPGEALSLYPYREATALQTVGYQELFEHFDERLSLAEAISLIKRNSRRYAKRQLTWMRRDGHWKHFGPGDWDLSLEYISLIRSEGLRLARLPAESAGLAPSQPPARAAEAVCLLRENRPDRAVALYHYRSFYLLVGAAAGGGPAPTQEDKILLHEAALPLEDMPVYARIPASLEPFMRELGFHPTIQAPPEVETGAPLWEKR